MELCSWCGKKLSEKQIKRGSKTCCRSCSNFFRYKDRKKFSTCVQCGKKFKIKNTNRDTYCSRNCFYASLSGKKKSDEHKKKIAQAQKKKAFKKNGLFECDLCKKIFISNTSLRAHKATCGKKPKILVCKFCGEKQKGKRGLFLHQSHCQKNDVSIKRLKAVKKSLKERIRKGNRSSETDIEKLFTLCLEKNEIKFEKQFEIDGNNHLYDFFLIDFNVIVETDGDWWHGNKNKFKNINDFQKRQFYIDIRNTRYAEKMGYDVFRFWGSDIIKNCIECLEEIIDVKSGKNKSFGLRRSI